MTDAVQKIVDLLPEEGKKPVFIRLTAGEFQQALRDVGADAKHDLSVGVANMAPEQQVRQMSDAWRALLTEKGKLGGNNGPVEPE